MVVVRPAVTAWAEPVLSAEGQPQLPPVALCSNFAGLDGGAFLAQASPLDAWRLALQYGVADAVMVGSRTVEREGVSSAQRSGYRWQPYEPVAWPQLRESGAALLEIIKSYEDLPRAAKASGMATATFYRRVSDLLMFLRMFGIRSSG